MREPLGREAKDYVRDALAQVEFVVVKTNKIDVYRRYVGMFSMPRVDDEERAFAEGRYLNTELCIAWPLSAQGALKSGA